MSSASSAKRSVRIARAPSSASSTVATALGLEERRRLDLRLALGMGEQRLGQRLEAVLAGDLRLGAALRLVREVEVLEQRLGVGLVDPRFQRGVELALLADRIEDRLAAVLQLPQIAQPLVERAQLRVVERPRRLLAVAGDERHRRPAVDELDRRDDLTFRDAQFLGDALGNGLHEIATRFDNGSAGLSAGSARVKGRWA